VIDYWNLTRPKIVVMVLLAMLASGWTAAEAAPSWFALFHAMLGTTGVILGAIALNQRLEYQGDAKMSRTAGRPLPSGRLTAKQVTRFGLFATMLGTVYLIIFSNAILVALAIISWVVYVFLYTSLKQRSIWQTPVGAVAGAMPALLGSAAVGLPWSPTGWTIFAVVFFWQLPHAMSIAWLYRLQFADANVKVATIVDPTGRIAGRTALAGAILLVPASLAPMVFTLTSWPYEFFAAILGLGYLATSFIFFRNPNDSTARRLLWASLLYLPLLLVALVTMRTFFSS
jgi:heme o synthase